MRLMKRRGTRALSVIPGVGVNGATPGQPTANITTSRQIAAAAALVCVSAFPEGYSRACMSEKAPTMFMKLWQPRRGRESTNSTPAIRSVLYDSLERHGNMSELVRELEACRGRTVVSLHVYMCFIDNQSRVRRNLLFFIS